MTSLVTQPKVQNCEVLSSKTASKVQGQRPVAFFSVTTLIKKSLLSSLVFLSLHARLRNDTLKFLKETMGPLKIHLSSNFSAGLSPR